MSVDTSELYYIAPARGKAFTVALTPELFEVMLPGGDSRGVPDQERIVLGMKALVEEGITEVVATWADEPWLQAVDPDGSGDLLQLIARDEQDDDVVLLCPLLALSRRDLEICIPARFLNLQPAPKGIETIFSATGCSQSTPERLASGDSNEFWSPITLPEGNRVPARKATTWGFMG